MITRHYKRIVKDILQRGGAKYDAYTVTASDGRPYYTAQEQPNYSADQTAISKSTDQPGVIIGNGTAAESEDSYWLARQRTSGFFGSVLPTHEMVDGTHTLCLYVTITNTENSSMIISEIGYALITPLMRRPNDSQTIGSPYAVERNVLIDRTVLASPITIAAGSSVRLKYALKTTDEIFSGSVVLIPKTINANGVYNASSDSANGYSEVTVSVTPNLQSKTVTQNGTVTPDQGYDGLSSVTTNVPNTYTASDEGKVVSSGALVPQTSRTVTENGTIDTTTNDNITVNVPQSAAVFQSKTVTENGTVTPDQGYDGLSSVVVNVSSAGGTIYCHQCILSSGSDRAAISIATDSSDSFTLDTLIEWLSDHGYNSSSNVYPAYGLLNGSSSNNNTVISAYVDGSYVRLISKSGGSSANRWSVTDTVVQN